MPMTVEERAVAERLAEAWKLFCELPVEDQDDATKFCNAVHAAQALVMTRPTRREFQKTQHDTIQRVINGT